MFGTTEYIAMAVAAVMAGTIGFYKFTISELEAEVALLQKSAVVTKFNYDDCKRSIDTQNKAVTAMNDIIIEKTNKLDNWKAKPAEIRYNTIYKDIYIYVDRNNTTGECNETKNVIDGIRHIDFSNI